MTRYLRVFAAWLMLSVAVAADILHIDSPGLTLYGRVRTSDTASVAVALTEGTSGAVGYYRVTDANLLSSGLNTAGTYTFKVFQGATPSTTANDPLRGYGFLHWNGTTEVVLPNNALTSDMTAASYVAELTTAVAAVSPFNAAQNHTWRFDNRNQVTASNNVVEAVGSSNFLVSMDFSGVLSPLHSIQSVSGVDIGTIVGETKPTVTSSARSADQKKVNIILNAASATDATYTVTVTITTTDSQTFVRKGRLILQ